MPLSSGCLDRGSAAGRGRLVAATRRSAERRCRGDVGPCAGSARAGAGSDQRQARAHRQRARSHRLPLACGAEKSPDLHWRNVRGRHRTQPASRAGRARVSRRPQRHRSASASCCRRGAPAAPRRRIRQAGFRRRIRRARLRRRIRSSDVTAFVELDDVRVDVRAAGTILDRLSLAVEEGKTLALIGRSGSGKTTALRLANALVLPTRGRVRVAGRETTAWNPIELRRRTGYVIQEVGLFPHLSVAENVGLVPQLEGWPQSRIDERTRELLELVGLAPGEYASRRPHQLSGGQRQRVGVARALAADPPLILLDEPFGALDPITRRELQREFRALTARLGKTAIFVTHDLAEAALVADRIALLSSGRLIAEGSLEELMRTPGDEVRAFLEAGNLGPESSQPESIAPAIADSAARPQGAVTR